MSLKEYWKNKKLKTGQRLFISINGDNAEPATVDMDGDFVDMKGMPVNPYTNEIKVLAPCDYSHLIKLEKALRSIILYGPDCQHDDSCPLKDGQGFDPDCARCPVVLATQALRGE